MGSILATIARIDPSSAQYVLGFGSAVVAKPVYRLVRSIGRLLRRMSKGEVLEVKWVKHDGKMTLSIDYVLGLDEEGQNKP